MNYKELTRKLHILGCQEIVRRGGGSHRKWINPSSGKGTVIPDWGNKDLKIGTIRSIIKQGSSCLSVGKFMGHPAKMNTPYIYLVEDLIEAAAPTSLCGAHSRSHQVKDADPVFGIRQVSLSISSTRNHIGFFALMKLLFPLSEAMLYCFQLIFLPTLFHEEPKTTRD